MIVDVAPEVKWIPENGYKNLKVAVEIDSDIDAQKVSERELRRRHKSLGALRIVTDRGLQVTTVKVIYGYAILSLSLSLVNTYDWHCFARSCDMYFKRTAWFKFVQDCMKRVRLYC